ncbi:hypothetical protein FOA52_011765 [Chlamydomonas sp. UWO 241]|nr:hypothetical protein FOA52_011765 [Chlamydomonas sp. UWO 241]
MASSSRRALMISPISLMAALAILLPHFANAASVPEDLPGYTYLGDQDIVGPVINGGKSCRISLAKCAEYCTRMPNNRCTAFTYDASPDGSGNRCCYMKHPVGDVELMHFKKDAANATAGPNTDLRLFTIALNVAPVRESLSLRLADGGATVAPATLLLPNDAGVRATLAELSLTTTTAYSFLNAAWLQSVVSGHVVIGEALNTTLMERGTTRTLESGLPNATLVVSMDSSGLVTVNGGAARVVSEFAIAGVSVLLRGYLFWHKLLPSWHRLER